MNIYDDNRLTRWGQRRLHSAFEETHGSRTWTVPTVAREIAPSVTPGDWDRGRRTIEAAIQAGDELLRQRTQLWWHDQWTDPNSQYAVRILTPDERALAEEIAVLMEQTMTPPGFLNVAGDLRDHPDARAVCETVATRSTLFVTRDDSTIVPEPINTWIVANAPRWDIEHKPAVVDVEDALIVWGTHEPESLAAVALLAFWPDDLNASDDAARRSAKRSLQALARGGTQRLALFTLHHVNVYASDPRWMQWLREHPVARTRLGERRHPTYPANSPEGLPVDPGLGRTLSTRPLAAASREQAEAAARRAMHRHTDSGTTEID